MEHFDVFLSYKQTDENGNLTPEVGLAEQLYERLNKQGISTFYSKKTIGILGEAKYKAVIDDALDSATVLVAIGTSPENLNSNWVRYEWDSFYSDILSGRKEGQLVSWTQGISINDLPRTLRQLETFTDIDVLFDFVLGALENQKSKNNSGESETKIVTLKELEALGVTALDAARAVMANDKYLYKSMPKEIAGSPQQWADFFERFPDFCVFIIDSGGKILGNFSFIGLTPAQATQMREGRLQDSDLDAYTGDNLYQAGEHIAYLMNLSVNPTAESVELYRGLWDSFANMLKNMAKNEGVYFSKIYYKAFLPEHEVKVAAKGFHILCADCMYGKIFVHDMDVNGSLVALDEELAAVYRENKRFKYEKANDLKIKNEVDVLSAYMGFWTQIEELFYHPRYYRLKRYFAGDGKLPRNSAEHQLGLVVAMWLRDIMQYSSVLLPFLPAEQQNTYYQYEQTLLNSALIRESMQEYQFSTENLLTENVTLSVEIHSCKSISVSAIKAFAEIWLDIGKLFMHSDVIDLRPYFYDRKSELPEEDDMELCEGLAVRFLTAMHLGENLLADLPDELADSYLDYKEEMLQAKIVKHTIDKYPFLKRELIGEF